MEDQPKPNGHEPTELQRCQAVIGQLSAEIMQRGSAISPGALLATIAIQGHQLETLIRMLVEGDENDPPILTADEFNRRMLARCSRHLEEVRKPHIAIVTGIPNGG